VLVFVVRNFSAAARAQGKPLSKRRREKQKEEEKKGNVNIFSKY
jgi:hypothetical protein